MRVDFQWNRRPEQITQELLGKKGQLFLANEAKKAMDPYVPALNLGLARNVRAYVENGVGVVHYQSPYARYQYKGLAMVSVRPGVPGSAKTVKRPEQALNYTTFRHPLATSEWDKAMWVARRDDLVAAAQKFLEGRT